MNPEDKKNQLQMFGRIVRDQEFFKKSEQVLKQFIKPKEEKVEEIKSFDGDSNAEG
jgi:hypothetical protein